MKPNELPLLKLKKNEDKRIRGGHLWVYSNEIDNKATPLKSFEPGQAVLMVDASNKAIGYAYVNPNTLIAARLLTRGTGQLPDVKFFKQKIKHALALRQLLYAEPCYRLLFGEADGVPGLVVDRYDQVLVVQITTAGMEMLKQEIVAALDEVLKPEAILLRNDSSARTIEGLESYVEAAVGDVPETALLTEDGVRFNAPIWHGQKTGWFYDQAANRRRLAAYVKDKRVLDVFSYIGGWGVRAAAAGAKEVICVDASSLALDAVAHNAELNQLQETVTTMKGDAFDVLKSLREERSKFDVIVVDPPAFIKKRKDYKAGSQAYRRINQLAIQALSKDGILVSCSCSHHMPQQDLVTSVLQASRHLDRNMQIIEFGGQSTDHPIHPAIPETEYLKAVFSRISPA